MYDGAAGWTSGTRNAESTFSLNRKNGASVRITTDGTNLWVVNSKLAKDEVFKYTMTGQLSRKVADRSSTARRQGSTIDPNDVGHLWIVDAGADRVYQYDDGATLTSGTATASASFALAANNTNPQGIADPLRYADQPSSKGPTVGNHVAISPVTSGDSRVHRSPLISPPVICTTVTQADSESGGQLVIDNGNDGPSSMRRQMIKMHRHGGNLRKVRRRISPCSMSSMTWELNLQLIWMISSPR